MTRLGLKHILQKIDVGDYRKALELYIRSNNTPNINRCEARLLEQFNLKLSVDDYEYTYPLYVKYKHKDADKLKKVLMCSYTEATYFLPKVLSDIVISFLIKIK